MRNCLPPELFNTIQYPNSGLEPVGLDRILQEVRYKIPVATDTLVRKEAWHTVCDFCARLGTLLDVASSVGQEVECSSVYGRFLRVVAATEDGVPVADGFSVRADMGTGVHRVEFTKSGSHQVVFSVQPQFSRTDGDRFDPKVPAWFMDSYGECIAHGTLMRVYAMGSQPWADAGLAKMHAVAYNNDLSKFSFGRITSGMRKDLMVDVEDILVANSVNNGNG